MAERTGVDRLLFVGWRKAERAAARARAAAYAAIGRLYALAERLRRRPLRRRRAG